MWLIPTLDIIFQISKTTVTLQIFEYFVRKFRLDIVMYQTGDVVRDLNFSQNAFLLSFFEQYGNSVILSVDDLRQIRAKDNENFYYIGKFILGENEKNTVLIDYIVELVRGYFVTMALYLQADNPNVTHASFSDVTFFLDTRILLAYLGYKTEEENNSVQEMIRSVKRSGANCSKGMLLRNSRIIPCCNYRIFGCAMGNINTDCSFSRYGRNYSPSDNPILL